MDFINPENLNIMQTKTRQTEHLESILGAFLIFVLILLTFFIESI